MPAKPGELKARWSAKENDILLEWGGEGASKSDGGWLSYWLTNQRGFDDTFIKELIQRGYDITTLKITVKKTVGTPEIDGDIPHSDKIKKA